ncbi:MAG: CotH kinase family protein [Bacteroidales bacterium]|nr:CotH kinase family protein [Bacteroidales bacterium]
MNAGLRIRGGWSRHPDFPKHSFRLFFRSEYGNSKLEYPLFGNEGVNQYDKIDLRTSQNYAWAQRDSRNTMLRDVFSRDTQRDMGQPYTRSRYCHLYLNGMYWGLYQTQERSEARFASDYFGGSSDDYDVIKVNTENWNYQIEATDGNLSLWQEVYNITLDGYSEMEPYYQIEGKDENGMPDKHTTKLVDIDNLMDYMLGIFYTGNFDAPTSSFGENNGANNFYAIKQRNNKTSGFVFFNHDAEHSLFSEQASPGVGLYEDRVNIGTRTDDYKMNVSWFGAFHPQWLHFKLSENAEYRSRFADRVYTHFRDGGVFDEDSAIARYTKRMDEIDQPIIAESARWGDARGNSVSYERDVHWINEARKTRDDFLAVRRNIVISQLRVSGLYPYLLAPKLEVENTEVLTEDYYFKDSFELLIKNENGNGTGDIYYTLDGKDPRTFGDGIEPTAELSAGDISMVIESSTVIRSRIYDNGDWSPLNVIKCMNLDEDYTGLRVSELHYNPIDSIFGADTISGADFEFIEFKNTGTHSINLSGISLDSAVSYVFPEGTVIMPGEFLVIASDYINFFERYGMYASGVYKRNFSNGGELIVLSDKEGEVLLYFTYNDKSPWPLTPDGQGYSLVSKKVDPEGMPGLYDYWNASYFIGGSPFHDDGNSEMPIGIENELFSNLKVYPNPARDFIVIQFESYDYGIEFDLRIYNITGVQVYAGKFQNGLRMDISSLGFEPGVYILNMNVEGVSKRVRLLYLGD